ncbi:MAG: MarR family transcriptional regulator [Friedmanniella sp.]|jgi:DNA-binding MarR family transcriptional regulator|nr:MarR family transcriptional regulator [Friedmanniella sp.]
MDQSLIQSLRETVLAFEGYRRAVAGHFGLGAVDTQALSYLRVAGPMGHTNLVGALEMSPAAISGLVDRLVLGGFVVREPHPHDRRRTTVVLTERGESVLRQSDVWMGRALEDFAEEDRAQVGEMLRRLSASMHRQTERIAAADEAGVG